MLAKRIIPCLDVKDGKVVKGTKFLNLRDAGDPVELAKFYNAEGADELVFLDITASYEKRDIMLEVVRKVSDEIFIPFTVGGGIKDIEDIRKILKNGADKVSINTAAVKDPYLIKEASEIFGSQCIVLAVDCKRTGNSWEVYIYGGKKRTGMDAIEWIKKGVELGAGEILLTSMDRDGTKLGYDNDLNRVVSESVAVPLIASGGAGTLEHIYRAFFDGKADAALAASIFHYGKYSIREVKEFLKRRGIVVRDIW